ncbi:PREDICTED: protein Cep78 homolog isoform X2 [Cyphomyrmex costatus]|uniref:Protein Cep78 like protein n=1 Tax=Cyphomyrmex costatus TaxID=456900 RepID=A0A195D1V7_9HYME|nr:PREDICTED: protein Cep78 homolog isoform X2 [Cyphomyrmex costatus]KYN06888.1 Protein Cep78 like protein [Cyphomyrmex costatus]
MDWHSARIFRRCARKDRRQPVLYTNSLLQCFVHSVAVCLKNSLMITSLTLDGIPLAPKYLRILADGLANNHNLRSLSLARCRIGDMGCYMLLESLQCNSNLRVLNLSSCCLTTRSAMCLSFFFKKRKADLLKNVWKESTLSRDVRTTEEGLQVLILDRNYRFSDIGLKQLIRMLKNDFWLKTLCLRCCGITQRGGEIVLELLQTNSVLTQIDLRDNEVSTDILQIIRKFLKKRKSKGERIPMKKRLLSHKHILVQDMVSNDRFCQSESKENRFLKTQTYTQMKMQKDSILQMQKTRHVFKLKRKSDNKYRLHTAVKKSHIKWSKADELKNRLSLMIEHNQNLIRDLETSTSFLLEERDRRLNAEEAYHKIQPRLKNLKNKIAMQNSIQSNMRYENQVYANLQNVFNDLKISTNGKILRVDDKSLSKEANENKIKFNICYKN